MSIQETKEIEDRKEEKESQEQTKASNEMNENAIEENMREEQSIKEENSKEAKSAEQEKSKEQQRTQEVENSKEEQSTKIEEDKKEKPSTIVEENSKENLNAKAEEATEPKEVPQQLNKKKHIWVWIFIVLLLLLVVIYCCIANYYKTHFYKNTSINNINCSDLTASEVTSQLDKQAQGYKLEIIGRNESGEEVSLGILQASDMNYVYTDTLNGVNAILNQQNEWLWITSLWKSDNHFSLLQGVSCDAVLLREAIMRLEAFQSNNMVSPKDAYISDYSEKNGGYEIISEVKGTKLDVNAAIACIEAVIVGNASTSEDKVNLAELGCYEEPKIYSDDEKLAETIDTINRWLDTEIIYDWNGQEVIVDNSVIKDWVSIKNEKPVLDEEAVASFVNEKALENDTKGKTATFTTALGIDISLKRLSYGWQTDCESEIESLTELIYAGAKEKREPAYIRKGVWKGQNDIGNSYIEADLSHQHLYVYEKGSVVFETDFVSGNINIPGCVTPAGIFGLTYKTTNAVLRGADYETPVTYWMPFYGNFGMHDATWRSSFGGDIFITNGSHGCLNLPLEAAAVIYGYVSEGSPIICYYY